LSWHSSGCPDSTTFITPLLPPTPFHFTTYNHRTFHHTQPPYISPYPTTIHFTIPNHYTFHHTQPPYISPYPTTVHFTIPNYRTFHHTQPPYIQRHAFSASYYLTTWNGALLETVTALNLVEQCPTFYRTPMFITLFTTARHLFLS
jgi:hypothetical protein